MPSYTYNPATGNYHGADGHPIPRAAIREAVDDLIAGAQVELTALTERMIGGSLALADWQTQSAAILRALHTAAAVAARGGWAQMDPADWGRLGAATKAQYRYLAGFAGDLAAGRVTQGQARTRIGMYGAAARGTYEAQTRVQAKGARQLRRMRNRLGVADHCPGCQAMTALGWVDIDDPRFVLPGQRECKTGCHCTLEYTEAA